MKRVDTLIYNKGFERLIKPFHFQDYNTLYSDGMLYFSNDQYLKNYFSHTEFPFRFVKDFFKVSRNHAKDFFAGKADTGVLNGKGLYADRETNEFIFLSNDLVYKNYLYLFEEILSKIGWESIRIYKKDNLITQDTYFLRSDNKIMVLSVSLVKETVEIAFGNLQNNELFIVPEGEYSLGVVEFKEMLNHIRLNIDINWISYFKGKRDIRLTEFELAAVLKALNIAKVRSSIVKIFDEYMYDSYMSDVFPSEYLLGNGSYTTLTPFAVGQVLYFINLMVHRDYNFNIIDIYDFYIDILSGKLYDEGSFDF